MPVTLQPPPPIQQPVIRRDGTMDPAWYQFFAVLVQAVNDIGALV
jgi:hypothetical protein